MKQTVVALLVVAAGCLGSFACFQETSVQARAGAASKPASQLAALSATTSPDRQASCSRQAREAIARTGQHDAPRASFTNYYDARLNRCFIEIETIGVSDKAGDVYINKS